jgi:hypothetical protein
MTFLKKIISELLEMDYFLDIVLFLSSIEILLIIFQYKHQEVIFLNSLNLNKSYIFFDLFKLKLLTIFNNFYKFFDYFYNLKYFGDYYEFYFEGIVFKFVKYTKYGY